MRPRLITLALLSTLALIPAVALADAAQSMAGTIEFSPSLAFSRTVYTPAGSLQSASSTDVDLSYAVGRCMNDHLEVVGLLLAQHRAQAGLGRNAIGAGAGVTLNFDPYQSLSPFFTAGFGALSYTGASSPDRSMLVPMLRLGVRSPVTAGPSLNLSIGYQHEVNRRSSVVDGSDAFEVAVGMSFMRPRAH